MRRAALFALLAVVMAVASACVETLDVPWGTPTATPTPTPPAIFVGDGRDGPITVTANQTVVNTCWAIASSGPGVVALAAQPSLTPGDLLLLLQVQDAGFATSGDATPVTAPKEAGHWDLATVSDASNPASIAVIASTMRFAYSSAGAGRAEACRVPQFTDVTVSAGFMSGYDWNGSTGGVLAFVASGTVDLTALTALSADHRGFRGGVVSSKGNFATETALDTDLGHGGGKGEGLDAASLGLYGAGNYANGAGGGDAHNGGGGGGGGGGAGGNGGKSDQGNQPLSEGRGGSAVVLPAAERLVFGGGGGGGHANDGTATPGVVGGGVVFVLANHLRGAGDIRARGLDATSVNVNSDTADGAGGGGGGGTVLVRVLDAASYTGTLRADGGAGGDVIAPASVSRHGPGGGGGGGRIAVSGFSPTISVTGGRSGTNVNQGADPWGAAAGSAGSVETLP